MNLFKFIPSRLELFEPLSIEVQATHPLKTLSAQVFSKGEHILSEFVRIPNDTESFVFNLKPELKAASKVDVIVYYITEEGDIVMDSLVADFGKELRNKVSKISMRDFLEIFVEKSFLLKIFRKRLDVVLVPSNCLGCHVDARY